MTTTHNQENKQVYFGLKLSPRLARPLLQVYKKTATPKTSYEEIANKHRSPNFIVRATVISLPKMKASIYQDNTIKN